MTSLPITAETEIAGSFLPIDEAELQAARQQDRELLDELELVAQVPRYYSAETGLYFANKELAEMARAQYDAESIARIEQFLIDQGTLNIPIVEGYTVTVDGQEHSVSMVAATEITANGANHGDMSSMLYLRDQIQAASALMELSLQDPDRYGADGKLGKELLLSALHLMSTPTQLERFNRVIELGEAAGQSDWPQISLHFHDLEGTQPNGWRNKQDSFQMLGYLSLDAIERGFLDTGELADAHKQFLSSIVPFLRSVGYPRYENSGSWEEIAAVRTSVMAIETALLHKIKTLVESDESLAFLVPDGDIVALNEMIQDGLLELGARLPFESPEYEPGSVKFREADAALNYVLMYDVPALLAEYQIPMGMNDYQPMTRDAIENEVLEQLFTLIDPVTNGMYRYQNDSYQRENFHTNESQLKVAGIKRKVQLDAEQRGGEVDLDEKQSLRDRHISDGRLAAWPHPRAQTGLVAAVRSLREIKQGDTQQTQQHHELCANALNATLSTVTSDEQWHAALDRQKKYVLKKVPAGKVAECYITYKTPSGEIIIVPSPHTPLNWGVATLRELIGLYRTSLEQSEKAA